MMRKLLILMLVIGCASAVMAQDACETLADNIVLVADACADAESLCLVSIDENGEIETQAFGLDDYMASEDFEAIETSSNEDSLSFALLHLALNEEPLSLLAFGNTRIENTVAINEIEVTAIRAVNLRQSPSVADSVVGSLYQGANYTAIGRLEDNTWVRIRLEAGQVGWVSAQFLKTDTGFAELSVVSPNTPAYIPMQAFDLQMADSCSGLLLIAPENDMPYELAINDLHIQFNGAAIVSQNENRLSVASLLGETHVSAFGFEEIAEANQVIYTPLSDSGMLAGIPSEAEDYTGFVLPYELFISDS